jgi:hypothetical protein
MKRKLTNPLNSISKPLRIFLNQARGTFDVGIAGELIEVKCGRITLTMKLEYCSLATCLTLPRAISEVTSYSAGSRGAE